MPLGEFPLEFNYATASLGDSLFSRLAECVSLDGEFAFDFAIGKNLHEVLLADETSSTQFVDAHLVQLLRVSERLDGRKVDGFIFNSVDVLETEFRHAALERHLTAFEARLLVITRTRLSTLSTTSAGAAESRTWTTTDATLAMSRTLSGFKIAEIHLKLTF